MACDPAGVTITFDGGTARVRLAIGADGQRSISRTAAGIDSDRRTYPQMALTLNLAHARAHEETSTEFHAASGPFTLVPLPGRRSSLVCVLDPARAAALAAQSDQELSAEIERRSHSILGAMNVEGGRGVFPLAIETADALCAQPCRAGRRGGPRRCRRSERRGSISACATRRRLASSWPPRTGKNATSATPI